MGFVGATASVWLGRENKGGRKECIGGTERIFLLAQTDESDWGNLHIGETKSNVSWIGIFFINKL
jgi:hypothetical protein